MTCIVGVRENGNVWIGADSAGSSGHLISIRRDPKVFRVGELLIGFTSSYRMGQALMHGWTPPKLTANEDLFAWMCTEFIDSVRTRLGDAGFRKVENGVETGGQFLVGVRGRLFGVGGDFQVWESIHDFDAVGCGEELAKGALHAMENIASHGHYSVLVESRISYALAAAAEFSSWVAPPFSAIVLRADEGEGGPSDG